jgi:integrase
MSVRKKCQGGKGTCRYGDHRCDHTWVSEWMMGGRRYPSVAIDDYAILRGARGHVVSKRDAETWEAQIRVDWQQGRDPRQPPGPAATGRTVRDVFATYATDTLPALKVPAPARSEIRHIVEYFDARPITDLEREAVGFEFMSALREGWRPDQQAPLEDGRGPVAVNRIMQRLRHAINWCIAQHPAILSRSPFHRYGIVIKTTDETQRVRRLRIGEEAALLAACDAIADADHHYAGHALKRRILGALYLGARGSELSRVRVGDLDWPAWTISLRAGKSQPRSLGVDPQGALAKALAPRRFLKPPHDFVFGDEDGDIVAHRTAWETVVLLAHGAIRADGVGRTAAESAEAFAGIDLHFHDLRRECASRWWEQTHDIWRVAGWLGHEKIATTQRYLALTDTNLTAADMAEKLGWRKGGRA